MVPNQLKKYHHSITEFIEEIYKKMNDKEQHDMDFFDVISRSIDTMQTTIAKFKLAAYSPDYIIDIPKNACAFFEFERATEMINIGRKRASEVLANIA